MARKVKDVINDPFNDEDIWLDDCYVKFNYRIFIKMFFYHFMNFFVIGPLILPIIIIIEGKTFAINMGFYGLNRAFYE